MRKKATSLFLVMLMAVTLVGFGGCKKKAPAPGAENAPAPATAPSNATAPMGNAPAGGANTPGK